MEANLCSRCKTPQKLVLVAYDGFMWYCPQCNKDNKLALSLERPITVNKSKVDKKRGCVNSIYNRSRVELRKRNINIYLSLVELVGCVENDMITYIESKFKPGMNWDNWGEWHVDHKQRISSFDLRNILEQKACFHYTNIQVLWKDEHHEKTKRERNPQIT